MEAHGEVLAAAAGQHILAAHIGAIGGQEQPAPVGQHQPFRIAVMAGIDELVAVLLLAVGGHPGRTAARRAIAQHFGGVHVIDHQRRMRRGGAQRPVPVGSAAGGAAIYDQPLLGDAHFEG